MDKIAEFFEAMVESCIELGGKGSGIFSMDLSVWPSEFPVINPGQFITLGPKPESELRRPFSVVSAENEWLSLIFKVVGENTEYYSMLKKEDKLSLAGPFGNPIPISKKRTNYILVAGGVGAAGLLLFAERQCQYAIDASIALIGAKDQSQIIGACDFKKYGCVVKTITDQDGFVTDLLQEQLQANNGKSVVIACGPRLMLRKTAELCKAAGNKCYVIMEEMMACGIGACKSCAIFGKDGKVMNVCTEGPSFDAEWVDWDKMAPSCPAIQLPKSVKKINNPMRIILYGQERRRLDLKSPILPASGCLSIQSIEISGMNTKLFGAGVTKGVTLQPRAGNPTPRVCEVQSGMINSIGLQNLGLEVFINQELPRWLELFPKVIVNISGSTIEEYVEITEKLSGTGIAAMEVNISCPNINAGKMLFGVSPRLTRELVKATRKAAPNMFIIVKLTPYAGFMVVDVAKAAVRAGADCIAFGNTYPSMAIDVHALMPKIGVNFGGQSGSGIHNLSVKTVFDLTQARLGVPIIGIGGVDGWEGAAEFILAGASAVGVGTELLNNPHNCVKIHESFLKWIKFHKLAWIGDLVGKVRLR